VGAGALIKFGLTDGNVKLVGIGCFGLIGIPGIVGSFGFL